MTIVDPVIYGCKQCPPAAISASDMSLSLVAQDELRACAIAADPHHQRALGGHEIQIGPQMSPVGQGRVCRDEVGTS
jgi:hypothetical protein